MRAMDDTLGWASRDYGGLITRVPAAVHAPRSIDELASTIRALREARVPWVVRGAGHSAGGQPLIHGGAVISMDGLAAVTADTGDAVTAQAGMRWLALAQHLADSGRRPAVLTDQLGTTLGGTLAVGGVGDTSHHAGLQIDSVRALTLVAPDGEAHALGPDDPRFRHALAGHGQLGAIAEVTLAVAARPRQLAVRAYRFPSVAAYLDAVAGAAGGFAYIRGRMYWRRHQTDQPVKAVIGAFADDLAAAPPAELPGASAASPPELVDPVAHAARDREPAAPPFAPACELVLPLAGAAAAWATLDATLRASGLPAHLADGASVAVVAPGALPLSPIPAGGGVVFALRPRFTDEVTARRAAVWLRRFAQRALDAGARLYPIGEEPDDARWAAAQYAAAWPAWSALKQACDPDRLCHPWHL